MQSPEEEKLARLHDYRSDLEDRIRGLTTKLRQTNVRIAELGPVVATQTRKREWEAGAPEREAGMGSWCTRASRPASNPRIPSLAGAVLGRRT